MNKVILMGVPHHNNLGDNAIGMAEKQYILNNYNDYEYYELSEETLEKCIEKVKDFVNDEDIIFLHGGGNFGDEYLYVEEGRRKVIQMFPNNTIILFPQTIYFSDTERGRKELEKSKEIYSSHQKLTIIAREKMSYNIMKKEFTKNRVLLTPDIVTYLNKTKQSKNREGLLFILRNDVEINITQEEFEYIDRLAKKYFDKIEYSDTARGAGILSKDREKKLEEMFEKYRNAKLVITDRLHGMIFAAITSTPCIAIDNYNHKVKACSETFKQFGYIRYIDDLSEMEQHIKELLEKEYGEYDNEFAIQAFTQIKEKV